MGKIEEDIEEAEQMEEIEMIKNKKKIIIVNKGGNIFC